MTSKNEEKNSYLFEGKGFDDQSVWELNQELLSGEISLEEYAQKLKFHENK